MSRNMPRHREAIGAHQLAELRRLLPVLLEHNAFYRERLADAGVSGGTGGTGAIESLDDFTARVALTTKAELAADQDAHPPYGTNLSFPIDQYTRLHQTSSTTGRPLRWLDTTASWSWLLEGWIEVLRAAGLGPGDRLFAAFSFGPFIGFWMGFEAAARLGCLAIAGGGMTSITRLRVILANEVTALCCTPTYAIRLGEVAREERLDLSRSRVRTIIVGGEPGGSLPAVRGRIESTWPGARVFDHHGMTEIGPATYECPKRPGVLHLLERSLFCEFIDPATGAAVADGADQIAELVVTTLGRDGSPLLRYRTGDLVRPGPLEPCACGRHERTLLGGIIGRADDMIFIRGVNLYPSAVEQLIRELPGVAEYRVEISEHRGMHELKVMIEPSADAADHAGLEHQVAAAFRGAYNLRVPIEIVPVQTLPRFELKARRWIRCGAEQPA
jgi:phenylacetate-CoA ligase